MSGADSLPVRKGYESLPRELLQPEDGVMTARALGVLAHLLSRPEGWKSSADRLAKTFKEGRAAIEKSLKELETLGYLARRRVQYANGQWGWVWLYGDDPAYLAAKLESTLDSYKANVSAGRTETREPHLGEVVQFPRSVTETQKSDFG